MTKVLLTASQFEMLKTGNVSVIYTEDNEQEEYYFLPFYFKKLEVLPISNSVNFQTIPLEKLETECPQLFHYLQRVRETKEEVNEIDLKDELGNANEIISGLEDTIVTQQEQIYLLNQKLEDNKKEIADLYYKLKT